MRGNPLAQDRLRFLYGSGKSMAEISGLLHCSEHKVVYWMDRYGLKKRDRSEAIYVKLNPAGDPFKIKNSLSQEEKFLFGLGLGIYWGEGNKVTRHVVGVANSDVKIIKLFVRFLLDICRVRRDKIHYGIVCFNDSNPEEVGGYWSKELKINKEKFGKIVQIPHQGKGIYKRKSKFGVCTVRVSNIKLKSWIMDELKRVGEAWVV